MTIIVNYENKKIILNSQYKYLSVKKIKKYIKKYFNIEFEFDLIYFNNKLNEKMNLINLPDNLPLFITVQKKKEKNYDINKLINIGFSSLLLSIFLSNINL